MARKKLKLHTFTHRMAYGVLQAAAEVGMTCPKDLSVVGYDNERRSAHTTPPLTTVDVPIYRMTADATQLLISYLKKEGRRGPFYQQVFEPVSLIARQSVRRMA